MPLEIFSRNHLAPLRCTGITQRSELASLTCTHCKRKASEVTFGGIGPDGSPIAWATCEDCSGEIITEDFFNNAG